jgi:exodeoxyribonuclease VII small subunit
LAESDLTEMEFCAMPETSNDDIKTLSFEAALAQLEEIVGKLESIAIYERGEALKAHCETLLRTAEARIEKITLSRDGKPTGTEPLDA